MELVPGVADYGDTKEIYVSGCCRISMVSSDTVRVVLFDTREIGEGKTERREAVSLLFNADDAAEKLASFAAALEAIRGMPALNGGRNRRPRDGAH